MRRKIGAHVDRNGVWEFGLWAPKVEKVQLRLISKGNATVPMQKEEGGYWRSEVKGLAPNELYMYQIGDKEEWPDPASSFQPQDVHGPSALVDHPSFAWNDEEWKGLPLKDMIIYELHVGTFTPEGTFEGIISKLDYLEDLGINALELMPIGQFPGSRNWGYDGVFPFAVQHSYGGPEGLKKLVNACHERGMAVIVDAVYNHIGPEGGCLPQFGSYFTNKYCTPWGDAINFDDAYSDEVRNYFIQNALMWFRDYHVDALRLDAVHAYKDFGTTHFLQELSTEVKNLESETGRIHVLIGECDLNDPKYILPVEKGGYGLDGQWCDEFHHSLHALVTQETDGYYSDFGTLEHLRKAFQDSFVYTGQYSGHRKKNFGLLPELHPYSQFVVFAQNHDQIGNRLLGDRISTQVSFETLKLLAGATLLSPSVPLLFMGEEFGEENPFYYFTSHTDEKLIKASEEGRKKEFADFHGEAEGADPQSEQTFVQSKLNWRRLQEPRNKTLWDYYKFLIHLRKTHPAFQNHERHSLKAEIEDEGGVLKIERHIASNGTQDLYLALNFGKKDTAFALNLEGLWKCVLDSAHSDWKGPGKLAPEFVTMGDAISIRSQSIIVYTKL